MAARSCRSGWPEALAWRTPDDGMAINTSALEEVPRRVNLQVLPSCS